MSNWIINQHAELANAKVPAVIWPEPLMVYGDNAAHTWRVRVTENGQPVDLSDAVITCYVVRPSGDAAVMVQGRVAGNILEADFPQQAYAHEGGITCFMRYTLGGKIVTAALMYASVRHGVPGQIIDPGEIAPSIEMVLELAAKVQPLVDALEGVQAHATTLAPGAAATATAQYVGGKLVLTLGIPAGETGATGSTGQTGPPGSSIYDTYAINLEDGNLYVFRPDGMPDTAPVLIINEDGYIVATLNGAGTPGTPMILGRVRLNPRGAYNASTAYSPMDWVADSGGSFAAIKATKGNPTSDTAYWFPVATQGPQGVPGRDGTGTGDMEKATYDTDGSGIVDNAEKLGGQLPGYYVPTSRKICGKALTGNITLTATDVGAATAAMIPNISEWALSSTKPTYAYNELENPPTIPSTAAQVGAVTLKDGKADPTQISAPMKTITTAYTLALADAGCHIAVNSSSARTITVPTDAAVAFPAGTEIEIAQEGAGTVTIAAASGVTLRSLGEKRTTAGQYAVVALKKYAANDWRLAGALV